MEEMLRTLVSGLVNEPDKIEISSRKEGAITTLELKVAPEDIGKVIGRQGKMAKAIRTLMKAYSAKVHEKINVDIVE